MFGKRVQITNVNSVNMVQIRGGKAVNLAKVNYLTVWERRHGGVSIGAKFENGDFESVAYFNHRAEAEDALTELLIQLNAQQQLMV